MHQTAYVDSDFLVANSVSADSIVWTCPDTNAASMQVCKEEADRMRLGLPLSGEFRKTRQKKYKEKHEQGRIAAAGLCLLRGENGTPEGEEGSSDQQKQQVLSEGQHQLQQLQQQPQPDPAEEGAVMPEAVLSATKVLHQPAPTVPDEQANAHVDS